VIGDAAVGLSAVLAPKRLGAERIILLGRHVSRTGLGRECGATDVVAERGDEAIARVRDLTSGAPVVIEAVGLRPAYDTAVGVVRVGGTVSRVGASPSPSMPSPDSSRCCATSSPQNNSSSTGCAVWPSSIPTLNAPSPTARNSGAMACASSCAGSPTNTTAPHPR
jgi:Zn-dependent alcohol dehydrogenase